MGFETRHVAQDVRGYAGPINLWVRFDSRGTLEKVILRGHNETPSYIRGIRGWLELLEGRRMSQPLTGPRGVDALSGATVTSEAILEILERSRERAARDLLGMSPPSGASPERSLLGRLFDGPRAYVVLLFFLLLVPVYLWGGWRARLVGLVASVLVLGVWLNVPFTLVDLASLCLGVLPGGGEKAVAVLGVLLISLAFGQIWCGQGCPFGAAQELLWLVTHPRGVDSGAGLGTASTVSAALELRARYLKFPLAALVLCLFWISGDSAYLAVDPMTTAFSDRMPGYAAVVVVVIGLGALVYFRPFCRYLCPAGAFLALSNKLRLLERLRTIRLTRRRAVARCDLGVTWQEDVDCLRCNRCLVQREKRWSDEQ